ATGHHCPRRAVVFSLERVERGDVEDGRPEGLDLERELAGIASATDLETLQAHRVRLLVKKGVTTARLKGLGAPSPEERRVAGQAINAEKQPLEAAFERRREEVEREAVARQLASESLDVTLPGTRPPTGGLHLL